MVQVPQNRQDEVFARSVSERTEEPQQVELQIGFGLIEELLAVGLS